MDLTYLITGTRFAALPNVKEVGNGAATHSNVGRSAAIGAGVGGTAGALYATSSAAAEDITATITTDLSRPELNPAARDEHVLSPRHTRKNITGSRISGFLESERLESVRRKQRRRKPQAQERRLGFAAHEFGTSSERSTNGERESGSHGGIGQIIPVS